MSKQETPKREKLYVRRRWVLRRFAIFLLVLLAVNHFMQIGFLLPIQGIRQVEERQGAPHGRVLARDWAPEIHRTHLVYLTAAEDAVTLADTYLSLYGWMGGFGWTLDCTTGEPLCAGEMTMSRDEREETVCYYYGRVDDPAIERVEVSVRGVYYHEDGTEEWEEAACLTAGPEDCSMTRFLSSLKSAQPTCRAKRETVASDSSRRWASCPMDRNKKVSGLVLM